MRKFLKVIRNIIIYLSAIALALVMFLYGYYIVSEKRLEKQNLLLEKNKLIRVIQADTILNGTPASLHLLPEPQRYSNPVGSFNFHEDLKFMADTLQDTIHYYLANTAGLNLEFGGKNPKIIFSLSDSIPDQGYSINIDKEIINIVFGNIQGLYYSMITLKVLIRNYGNHLPIVEINDYPDLAVRGLLLEMDREKIPDIETLLSLVDIIADLKYNQLQLFINTNLSGDSLFLDIEKIQNLDSLCKAHFIELIPVLNSSSHKITGQIPHEMIRPRVFSGKMNIARFSFANNPEDSGSPEALVLISRMAETVLPFFSSDLYGIHFNAQDYENKESIFTENIANAHALLTKHNKRMLLIAPCAEQKEKTFKTLPREIILTDHGNDPDYSFEKHCQMLKSSGYAYVLCPGTAGWNSITGRTNFMLANIASAAMNADKYDAWGIVLNDRYQGHFQITPVNYAAYAVAGALSWNCKSMSTFPLIDYLNNNIFVDRRSIMGDLALDLGRYSQFEEFTSPEYTTTILSLLMGIEDKILVNAIRSRMISEKINQTYKSDPEAGNALIDKYNTRHPLDFSGLLNFLDEKEALLNNIDLKTKDSTLIKDEYRNAIRLIRAGTQLQYYIQIRNAISPGEKNLRLNALKSLIIKYLDENKRLWAERKIVGDYQKSVVDLNNLIQQIDEELSYTDDPLFVRHFRRFKEKIVTSAIILGLKYF